MKEQYDVFISYNSKNRDIVENFIEQLPELNINLFIDIWDLTPGKPWQEEIELALQNSKNVAVFIGTEGLGRWQNEEMRVSLDKLTKDTELKVIPILLPNTNIESVPLFLSRLTWIDFSNGLDNTIQYKRFLKALNVVDTILNEKNFFLEKEEVIKKTLEINNLTYMEYNYYFVIAMWVATIIIGISLYNSLSQFIIVVPSMIFFSKFFEQRYKNKHNKFLSLYHELSPYLHKVDTKGLNNLSHIYCSSCQIKTPSIFYGTKSFNIIFQVMLNLGIILYIVGFIGFIINVILDLQNKGNFIFMLILVVIFSFLWTFVKIFNLQKYTCIVCGKKNRERKNFWKIWS